MKSITLRITSDHRISIVQRALDNALDARDLMGYKLTHAQGHLDDEEFQEIRDDLGASIESEPDALLCAAYVLSQMLGDRFDSDVLSMLFRCKLEDATAAINMMSQGKIKFVVDDEQ